MVPRMSLLEFLSRFPIYRTYRLAMLGMALAHLFDVKEPQDVLRGFSNVLNEYDTMKDPPKEDGDRPRMVRGPLRRRYDDTFLARLVANFVFSLC